MEPIKDQLENAILPISECFKALKASNLEICESTNKGRCIRANSAFKVGDKIFTQPAYAQLLSINEIDRCQHCLRGPTKTSRCGACKTAHYCSPSCQKAAWKTHKVECPLYKVILASQDPDTAMFSLRILRRFYNEFSSFKAASSSHSSDNTIETFQEIMNMCDPVRETGAEAQVAYATAATKILRSGGIPAEVSTVRAVLARTLPNSFSLSDRYNDDIGRLCFANASLFNHSCRPNAWAFIDGLASTIRIVAIQEIAPGDEISISYVDGSNTQTWRRNGMYRNMGFWCHCDHCASSGITGANDSLDNDRCPLCEKFELLEKKSNEVSPGSPAFDKLYALLQSSIAGFSSYDADSHITNHIQATLANLIHLATITKRHADVLRFSEQFLEVLEKLKVPHSFPIVTFNAYKAGLMALRLTKWEDAKSLLLLALVGLKLAGNSLTAEVKLLVDLATNPAHFVHISTQILAIPDLTGTVQEIIEELLVAFMLTPHKFTISK